MEIEFIKCHGSSNDFILIDEYRKDYSFSEQYRKDLSLQLCHREKSVGADGILFFQKSRTYDARMRMFNPDGTEAEMCGNGVRCVGRYAQEMLSKEVVFIETMKGVQEVIKENELEKDVWTVSVSLKPVSIDLKDIPLFLEGQTCIEKPFEGFLGMRFSAVSMGNPHLISFVEEIDLALLEKFGRKVNQIKSVFPEGMNLSFCQLLEVNKLIVMTYERGLGITKACGTAMSAASLIATVLGYCDKDEWIEIYNTGGLTKCKIRHKAQSFEVQLLGNATFEYKAKLGSITLANIQIIEVYQREKEAYLKVINKAEKFLMFKGLKNGKSKAK